MQLILVVTELAVIVLVGMLAVEKLAAIVPAVEMILTATVSAAE